MAIYHNIDGTTKSSFKIGTQGIVLSKAAIKEVSGNQADGLTVNGNLVLTATRNDPDETVTLQRQMCYDVKSFPEKNETVFYFKSFNFNTREWENTTITLSSVVNTGTPGITGPVSSTDGNIAVFDGTDGNKIKDANVGISNTVNNNNNSIPTGAAVVNFIHDHAIPLGERMIGYDAGKQTS